MWQSSPKNISLNSTDIHIWKAKLNISLSTQNDFWQILSADEKTRANRFRFPHLRMHYIAARGVLRNLIAQYLSISPADIQFNYGKQGKPFLVNFPNFKFNVSHSEDLAVFAFAKEMEIGIDVEYINPKIDIEVIAPNFFSQNEVTTLFKLAPKERITGFFNCWTRKEAFIKAKGGGLSIPLDQFEVTLLAKDTPKILAINWAPEDVKNWSLFSFNPRKEFVGALTTNGNIEKVSFFEF
jgi:4'-phosphopantetheinyl transferase